MTISKLAADKIDKSSIEASTTLFEPVRSKPLFIKSEHLSSGPAVTTRPAAAQRALCSPPRWQAEHAFAGDISAQPAFGVENRQWIQDPASTDVTFAGLLVRSGATIIS
jgi:hypothetical protein